MRKKARYQELLDAEDQLKEIKEQEALRSQRMATIQKFLTLRESMLNNSVVSSASQDAVNHLKDLVDHMATFQFEINDHENYNLYDKDTHVTLNRSHENQVSIMTFWDRKLQECIHEQTKTDTDRTNSSIKSSFSYDIVDGVEGIAMSNNGTGFIRVDLLLRRPQMNSSQNRTVLSGVLHVRFAATSNRLSSATWTTLQHMPTSRSEKNSVQGQFYAAAGPVAPAFAAAGANKIVAPPPADDLSSSSSSHDSLENQMVHPSVVSLDQKPSSMDVGVDSNGPGMAI
jgi:hypothetical protein